MKEKKLTKNIPFMPFITSSSVSSPYYSFSIKKYLEQAQYRALPYISPTHDDEVNAMHECMMQSSDKRLCFCSVYMLLPMSLRWKDDQASKIWS